MLILSGNIAPSGGGSQKPQRAFRNSGIFFILTFNNTASLLSAELPVQFCTLWMHYDCFLAFHQPQLNNTFLKVCLFISVVSGKFSFKKKICVCNVFPGFVYHVYVSMTTAWLRTGHWLDTKMTGQTPKPGSLLPKFQEARRWTGGCRPQRTNHSWSSGQYLSAHFWLGPDFQSFSSRAKPHLKSQYGKETRL